MSRTRGLLAALAVCALLGGPSGCGSGDAHEREDGPSVSPVGKVLDETDEEGRNYREVDKEGAPYVAIEVQPDSDDGWDVTLKVRNFRFSPAGTRPVPAARRGIAHLYVDGRTIARLRGAEYHLAGRLVPRGTHHVTARLYADDGTVWAVRGKPVESTADLTASESGAPGDAGATPTGRSTDTATGGSLSAPGPGSASATGSTPAAGAARAYGAVTADSSPYAYGFTGAGWIPRGARLTSAA
ncbi:nuclear transport factor 2 family protein [Streptomyces sp. 142MFCol3.1]|uniref:nuclear transport factor 2 family protein n=1 Tax=Streptomyces sp. 142MFCol3.1 TaxID=1172179 RepID=UPI001F169603|nr:nuclear transport factor 2 family protein [Streptomyces sp. 142MFCol3.1]